MLQFSRILSSATDGCRCLGGLGGLGPLFRVCQIPLWRCIHQKPNALALLHSHKLGAERLNHSRIYAIICCVLSALKPHMHARAKHAHIHSLTQSPITTRELTKCIFADGCGFLVCGWVVLYCVELFVFWCWHSTFLV